MAMVSDMSEPLLGVPSAQSGYGGVRIESSIAQASEANRHLPEGTSIPQPEYHEELYPEGGIRAWLTVFASLCSMICCFGLMNTIGIFQAYLLQNQLSSYSAADVGWIFGLYLFVTYFSGIQTGSLFDARGPMLLMAFGSTCLVATMFLFGVCKAYLQFILVFGILGGLGTSLISSAAIGSVTHYFHRRRGFASGIAACGGSIGGVIFPLMMSSMFTSVGFAWATRALGFFFIALLVPATLLMGSRFPKRSVSKIDMLPDIGIFRDMTFLIMTLALFFVEWGIFVPLGYLTSFALSAGIDEQLSYQLLAILNLASFFGRWVPGLLADKVGRFNTMILMIALGFLSTLALWLPATLSHDNGTREPLLLAYAVVFGFASGSTISLGPVCAGQLCSTANFGKYFASCFAIVGLGTLVCFPIAGAILHRSGGSYAGLAMFTSASFLIGLVLFAWARASKVGWGLGRQTFY